MKTKIITVSCKEPLELNQHEWAHLMRWAVMLNKRQPGTVVEINLDKIHITHNEQC